jgi:glutathione S-transferase
MMRLLGRRTSSNVQKVLWLLDELGLEAQREDFGGPFGKNKDPEFLRLNPNGVVPVLIDGDEVLWESNTILRYLANKHGPTTIYPSSPAGRALCERWMDWQLSSLNAPITALFVGLIRTPLERRDEKAIEAARNRAEECLFMLDRQLGTSPYAAGDQLTLADICLGMYVYRWFTLDIPRTPMQNLDDWYVRIQERAPFRKHIAIGLA